jgi:biopolymer transport protein ExbD
VRRVLLLGLLLLAAGAACSRRGAAPAPAPSPSKEKLDAFRRCNEATARLADPEPGEEVGARSAQISRACADIYSEPGCAAAWRDPPARIEERPGALARACRDAYCPRLAEPRPALCATQELPPPVEMIRGWRELHIRILARELGVAPEIVEALSPPAKVTVSKQVAPPAPELPPLVVRVLAEGGDARVSIDGRKESVLLGGGRKRDALAALLKKTNAPAGTAVVLNAEAAVGYDRVVRVIEVLRAEGFVNVSFEAIP